MPDTSKVGGGGGGVVSKIFTISLDSKVCFRNDKEKVKDHKVVKSYFENRHSTAIFFCFFFGGVGGWGGGGHS